MYWYNYTRYGLVVVNVVMHIVALVLLKQQKDNTQYKNQRNIITALCVSELSGALLCGFMYITRLQTSKITSQIMLCFIVIIFTPCYYVIMGLVTIDRFLAFYLNIRYKIYVTLTKLMKLTIGAVITFFTTAIVFSVLIVTQKVTMQWLNNNKILPLFMIIDVAYIFLTVATYIYIYIYSLYIDNNQESERTITILRVKITLNF